MWNNNAYDIKKTVLLLTIIIGPFLSKSQDFGVGGAVMYNFQSEGFGFGGRANFYPNNDLSFVPQITFYPGFNTVSEYLVGLSIEYKVIKGYNLNYYLLTHGAFNHWLNADESPLEDAQSINWNLEGGVGITTNGCLRPFLEYRYNIKFQDTHLRFGLLYIFGCGGRQNTVTGSFGSGYRNPKRVMRTNICPAY